MKRIATLLVVGAILAPTAAHAAEIVLEEGATFTEDGRCYEADGTPGMGAADGQCITEADYNELYSYENLAATPSAADPTQSIAERYGMVDDGVPAAERVLGGGLTEPFTFAQLVNGQTAL